MYFEIGILKNRQRKTEIISKINKFKSETVVLKCTILLKFIQNLLVK